jgi:CHAD domain-containing protein/CYTH domain-containing protein
VSDLLTDDAQRGARVVALALLARVDAAHARLADPADRSALHDFRVAVRRLRSWLLVEDGLPRPMVPKRAHKWLRRLAHSTSPGRDDEVLSAWLEGQRADLPVRQRAGLNWLLLRVGEHRQLAEGALQEEIARDLARIRTLLVEKLARYEVPHDVERGARGEPFGTAMAALVRAGTATFVRRMRLVRSTRDGAAIHRARIAGKRVRYQLEPFADVVPEVPAVLGTLKSLQDVLGDHHDAHVWAERVHALLAEAPTAAIREGTRAVLARIEQYGMERFAALEALGLGGAAVPAVALHEIAQAFERAGGVGVEVERKYLLRALPVPRPRGRLQLIDQGYLPGQRLVERVRRVRSRGVVTYLRTVKGGSGMHRLEVEEECSAELFASLWPLTKGRRVRKKRYLVPDGERTWALDAFTDRPDLVLAEIELPSVESEVVLPSWLAPFLDREVTEESAYVNAVLAR